MMRRRIACPLDHAHRQLLRISGPYSPRLALNKATSYSDGQPEAKSESGKIENVLQFAIGDDEAQFGVDQ